MFIDQWISQYFFSGKHIHLHTRQHHVSTMIQYSLRSVDVLYILTGHKISHQCSTILKGLEAS